MTVDFERQQEAGTLLTHQVLDRIRALGVDSGEVSVSYAQGHELSVRGAQRESAEHYQSQSLTITLIANHRKGVVTTSDYRLDQLDTLLEKALALTRHVGQDLCHGLPDPDAMATDYPDLDLYHPQRFDADGIERLLLACEAAGRGYDQAIEPSSEVSYSAISSYSIYANTAGFYGICPKTRYALSCTVIAKDASGKMQRQGDYTVSRAHEDLSAPEVLAEQVAKQAVSRLGARTVKTQYAPVVFSPEVAIDFLSYIVRAMSGPALYRGASYLADQLGQSIFPEAIELVQRPHIKKSMGGCAFDQDGLMTREQAYVTGGVLSSYVLDTYAARRLNLASTANAGGVFNLAISHTEDDLSALLAKMGTGLWVTEVFSQGVDLVTGDYSKAATGFWVENGEITTPLQEFTIASNLSKMCKDLVAVGNDVDVRGRLHSGSMWIREMSISGL